ncbi:PLG [Mytilus coruscus]|uniref:PLG n=1 Tax=Mytilus coruscus TaxID=42192 RepID=A0A6J8EBL9_MYTCO|nr:PLG [Mytilus coruscus]
MTGKTCQRWDATVPHVPAYTMGPEHANYCRAPDNDTRVWCMTVDPIVPWEYCNISECDDCYIYIDNVASYSGTISTTITGKTCQRWDATVPHVPVYTMGPEHANYCRAPDNDTRVWCMTVDPIVPWEYCNISECVTSTTEITTNEETTRFNTMTTKTISQTFVQTSDHSPPTTNIIYTTTNCSSSYICPCGSRAVYWMQFNQANLTQEEKLAILDEEKARLRQILIVDKTILTSYIRARTSAEDKRPSAKSIGLVGALMLIIVGVVIVLSDLMSCLPKLYNHFKTRH